MRQVKAETTMIIPEASCFFALGDIKPLISVELLASVLLAWFIGFSWTTCGFSKFTVSCLDGVPFESDKEPSKLSMTCSFFFPSCPVSYCLSIVSIFSFSFCAISSAIYVAFGFWGNLGVLMSRKLCGQGTFKLSVWYGSRAYRCPYLISSSSDRIMCGSSLHLALAIPKVLFSMSNTKACYLIRVPPMSNSCWEEMSRATQYWSSFLR